MYLYVRYLFCGKQEIVESKRIYNFRLPIKPNNAYKIFYSPGDVEAAFSKLPPLKKGTKPNTIQAKITDSAEAGYYKCVILEWGETKEELQSKIDNKRIKIPSSKAIVDVSSDCSINKPESLSRKEKREMVQKEKQALFKAEKMTLNLRQRPNNKTNPTVNTLFGDSDSDSSGDYSADSEDHDASFVPEDNRKKTRQFNKLDLQAATPITSKESAISTKKKASLTSLGTSYDSLTTNKEKHHASFRSPETPRESPKLNKEKDSLFPTPPLTPSDDSISHEQRSISNLEGENVPCSNETCKKITAKLEEENERYRSLVEYYENQLFEKFEKKLNDFFENKIPSGSAGPSPPEITADADAWLFERELDKNKLVGENVKLFEGIEIPATNWKIAASSKHGDSMVVKNFIDIFWTRDQQAERNKTGKVSSRNANVEDVYMNFHKTVITPEKKARVKELFKAWIISNNPAIDETALKSRLQQTDNYFTEKFATADRAKKKRKRAIAFGANDGKSENSEEKDEESEKRKEIEEEIEGGQGSVTGHGKELRKDTEGATEDTEGVTDDREKVTEETEQGDTIEELLNTLEDGETIEMAQQ